MGTYSGREVVLDGHRCIVGEGPYFIFGYGPCYNIEMQPPVRFSIGVSISPVNAIVREADLIEKLEGAREEVIIKLKPGQSMSSLKGYIVRGADIIISADDHYLKNRAGVSGRASYEHRQKAKYVSG